MVGIEGLDWILSLQGRKKLRTPKSGVRATLAEFCAKIHVHCKFQNHKYEVEEPPLSLEAGGPIGDQRDRRVGVFLGHGDKDALSVAAEVQPDKILTTCFPAEQRM